MLSIAPSVTEIPTDKLLKVPEPKFVIESQ
jgi:hypothetical protein